MRPVCGVFESCPGVSKVQPDLRIMQLKGPSLTYKMVPQYVTMSLSTKSIPPHPRFFNKIKCHYYNKYILAYYTNEANIRIGIYGAHFIYEI